MSKTIRIGTRDSKLALWQAETVQQELELLGYKTRLIPVKSTGDLVLDKPLYELGITGVFTKTLDVSMLNGTVDMAVHSMKDVPTQLPQGIVQSAVLERGNTSDILVYKDLGFPNTESTIATGSLRRKAQWLNKYPDHKVENLRGNVITRLEKLKNNPWNGAIFAKAGLERLGFVQNGNEIKSPSFGGVGEELDWMIPAPAQGAVVAVTLANDLFTTEAVSKINHKPTNICTTVERSFLRTLEGGCTAPIGGLATIKNDTLTFSGVLLSLDGKEKLVVKKQITIPGFPDTMIETSENLKSSLINFGKSCALEILNNGGYRLMQQIKAEIQ